VLLIEGKAWYLSKGVWGGIVAALAGVASLLLNVRWTDTDENQLVDLLVSLGSLIGGLLAVLGRLFATRKITSLLPPAEPSVATRDLHP
jgi:hypothetical protein